ncbi:hypothetical protein PMI01_04277 [Caulobacter sp. AP07]|uniref:hypothetical protein n=1 Tax=Caulobacter sp. AP07 TaxID=1144304 RepID=UPI000271F801|nr:hypothetical protein [Caulobacter sp. AP07]EJL25558.1 hypothetical protein PMI01_04277 [Caulobacter sp. AP07]
MKRWPAIIALGLMAGPVVVAFVVGFGAVFWDGYGPPGFSRTGLHRGAAPLALLIGAVAVGLWWAGWLRFRRAPRRTAGVAPAPASQIPSLILAIWFLALLGVFASLAASNASAPF